jgi:hypothetical protein
MKRERIQKYGDCRDSCDFYREFKSCSILCYPNIRGPLNLKDVNIDEVERELKALLEILKKLPDALLP